MFEWSKGANKAIFDTKSNVIKMNTTGAFFLVRGSSTTDYSRNIKELEQKVTRLDNEKFSTLDLGKYEWVLKKWTATSLCLFLFLTCFMAHKVITTSTLTMINS
nr:hypothetical protein [Mycoplasmopsis bovis]